MKSYTVYRWRSTTYDRRDEIVGKVSQDGDVFARRYSRYNKIGKVHPSGDVFAGESYIGKVLPGGEIYVGRSRKSIHAGNEGVVGRVTHNSEIYVAQKKIGWVASSPQILAGGAALLLFCHEHAVEKFIDDLGGGDVNVREHAACALGDLGDNRAADSLIAALKDEFADVRRSAVIALGKLGDKRALEPLVTVLKQDDCSDLRSYAARILGDLGSAQVKEPLVNALDDENENVRIAVINALDSLWRKGKILDKINGSTTNSNQFVSSKTTSEATVAQKPKTKAKVLGIIAGVIILLICFCIMVSTIVLLSQSS